MVAGISVRFGVTQDQLTPAMKKQRDGLKLTGRELGQLTASMREYDRTAFKAVMRHLTAGQKLERLQEGLNRQVKAGLLTQKEAATIFTKENERLNKKVSLLDKITGSLGAQLGGYLAIQSIVSQTVQLLQQQAELEKRSAEEGPLAVGISKKLISEASARSFDQRELGSLFAAIDELARQPGSTFSRADLYNAAYQTFGATIGSPAERTQAEVEALRGASKVASVDKELLIPVTEGLVAATKQFKQAGLSVEEAQDLYLRIGEQSRAQTAAAYLNMSRGFAAVVGSGFEKGELERADIEQAGAFMATVSSNIDDRRLELASQAMLSFQKTLDKRLPEKIKGFADQFDFLRSAPPEMQRSVIDEVLDNLEGRGATHGTIRQIAQNFGAGDLFDAALADITKKKEKRIPLEDVDKEVAAAVGLAELKASGSNIRAREFGEQGVAISKAEELIDTQDALRQAMNNLAFMMNRTVFGENSALVILARGMESELEARLKFGQDVNEEQLNMVRKVIQDAGLKPLNPRTAAAAETQ